MLGPFPPEPKKALTEIFRYVLPNSRFGPVAHQTKAENFNGAYLTSTTALTIGEEFTIPHGLGRVPYLAIPVLPLDAIGTQAPNLLVSRAADSQRLYFTSNSTNAVFALYVE